MLCAREMRGIRSRLKAVFQHFHLMQPEFEMPRRRLHL
jgi:hypothetical protein